MFKQLSLILALISIVLSGWAVYKVNKKTDSIDSEEGGKNYVAIVEDVFNQKPEIVLTAFENVQKRARLKQETERKEAVAKHQEKIYGYENDPMSGNLKGDVTVAEFFDYRCGYCRKAYGYLHEAVKNDGNVRIVYKEYPIFGGEPLLAKAALAAHLQGKYDDIHKAFMTSKGHLDMAEVLDIAKRIGLDVEKFKKDIKSPEVEKELKENMELGQKLKIDGTPAFIIGDKVIAGLLSVDDLEKKFKDARNKKSDS